MAKNLPQRIPDDTAATVLLAMREGGERTQAQDWLEEAGYAVLIAETTQSAVKLIQRRLDLDVVVASVELVDKQATLLDAVAESPKGLEIVLEGEPDVFVVTQAMAAGARSFLPRPVTQLDLLSQVLHALHSARTAARLEDRRLAQPAEVTFAGLVGSTPRMREVMEILRKAAPTDAPVVILGESGTGKELIARAIHESSPRAGRGEFVALHLKAAAEGVMESELFGHKKGAFTNAMSDRVGKFKVADGGTLFLDELGDIPLSTQTKLLRVLETRSFEPVGSNKAVTSDFRLIAATNQDILGMIKEGEFREELWYRLKVVTVELPPLRERRADIPLLVDKFLAEYADRYGKRIDGVDKDAMAALSRHPWVGNIRELRNVVQQMVILAEGATLTLRDVPRDVRGSDSGEVPVSGDASLAGRTMEEIEREAIRETLEHTNGNRKAAAEMLQIGERTLYRKIEKYGL